jgi:hypothetical protein
VAEKGIVLGGHDRLDGAIGKRRDRRPDTELAVIVVNEECSVAIQNFGCSGRPVVSQGSYIRKVGKGPDDPDDKEENDEHKRAEGCKEGLHHGSGLLLPVFGVLVLLIPSTDGTGVDASAPAASERADDEHKSNTDENIDEQVIGHILYQMTDF